MNKQELLPLKSIEIAMAKNAGIFITHNTFGVKEFASDLGYTTPELMYKQILGKKILDITAGYGLFGHTVDSSPFMRMSCTSVISVDPISHYLKTILRSGQIRINVDQIRNTLNGPNQPVRVSAFAEFLPFQDNSVDLIVDRNGILLWYDADKIAFQKAFSEMKRVLKAGGEIRTAKHNAIDIQDAMNHSIVFDTVGLQFLRSIHGTGELSGIIGYVLTK